MTVTVSAATTATTTTLTAPGTGNFGTAITLSATVAGAGATPSGTVEFYDGTTPLGSGTLASGTATLSVNFAGGTHSLSAVYSGDTTFAGFDEHDQQPDDCQERASTTAVTAKPNDGEPEPDDDIDRNGDRSERTGQADRHDDLHRRHDDAGASALNSAGVRNPGGDDGDYRLAHSDGELRRRRKLHHIERNSGRDGFHNDNLDRPDGAVDCSVWRGRDAFRRRVTSGASGTPTGTVSFYTTGRTQIATGTLASASTIDHGRDSDGRSTFGDGGVQPATRHSHRRRAQREL